MGGEQLREEQLTAVVGDGVLASFKDLHLSLTVLLSTFATSVVAADRTQTNIMSLDEIIL